MSPNVGSQLTGRQRGDFQTPEALARKIWTSLDATQYDLVLEPTFGLGSFLTTMPEGCTAEVLGWEIHGDYHEAAAAKVAAQPSTTFRLLHGDILQASSADIGVPRSASLLVIGNPPWVTNAEQSILGGKNTGPKRNVKALSGLDALTGKANFDLSEAIILHIIAMVQDYLSVQFALLTKFTVLRNLLSFIGYVPRVGDFEFHRIDAQRYFGAAVDAGLLKFRLADDIATARTCAVYDDIAGRKVGDIGLVGNRLVYDIGTYERLSFMESQARVHYVWRQGVKHDLRDVFELTESADGLRNRRGELVDVEPEVLYQLYKSSDVYHGRTSRFVIPIYQRDLQDDLAGLSQRFPRLWAYLQRHADAFRSRQSRIYRNRPLFSVFGVGDYTHCRYKVAIGALYPEPSFRLLESKPRLAVPDDTCYMLATDAYPEAVYLLAVLSLDCTRDFLLSISYRGDKRRFSKEVLERVMIPPFPECPPTVRSTLATQWQAQGRLSSSVTRELREWLSTYSAPTQSPAFFQRALF